MNPKWSLKRKTGAGLGPKKPPGPRWKPPYNGKDPAHLGHLHTLPCALVTHPIAGATPCSRDLEVHHSTNGRGKSQRTDDRKAFPLCAKHHRAEFHERRGTFEGWTREQRREWQDRMSSFYAPK